MAGVKVFKNFQQLRQIVPRPLGTLAGRGHIQCALELVRGLKLPEADDIITGRQTREKGHGRSQHGDPSPYARPASGRVQAPEFCDTPHCEGSGNNQQPKQV